MKTPSSIVFHLLISMMCFVVGFMVTEIIENYQNQKQHEYEARIQAAYTKGFVNAVNSCVKHLPLSTNQIEILPIFKDMGSPEDSIIEDRLPALSTHYIHEHQRYNSR